MTGVGEYDFEYTCNVGGATTQGRGRNKRLAKSRCAVLMYMQLKRLRDDVVTPDTTAEDAEHAVTNVLRAFTQAHTAHNHEEQSTSQSSDAELAPPPPPTNDVAADVGAPAVANIAVAAAVTSPTDVDGMTAAQIVSGSQTEITLVGDAD